LTDIVKGQDENITGTDRPAHTIPYWMKNLNTLEFLEEWEIVHNDNFKLGHLPPFITYNSSHLSKPSSHFSVNSSETIKTQETFYPKKVSIK